MLYRSLPPGDGKALANALALAGAALLALGFLKIRAELGFPGKWAIAPVLGAVMIISAGRRASLDRVVLSSRLAVWFGLISFPLYLWHWPLLSFARIMEEGLPRADIRLGAVLLAIVLAWLTYRLVERPIRFGTRNRLTIATLCVLMAGMGALGYYTFRQNGLGFRMQSQNQPGTAGPTMDPSNTRLSDGSCEKLLNFAMGPGAAALRTVLHPKCLW